MAENDEKENDGNGKENGTIPTDTVTGTISARPGEVEQVAWIDEFRTKVATRLRILYARDGWVASTVMSGSWNGEVKRYTLSMLTSPYEKGSVEDRINARQFAAAHNLTKAVGGEVFVVLGTCLGHDIDPEKAKCQQEPHPGGTERICPECGEVHMTVEQLLESGRAGDSLFCNIATPWGTWVYFAPIKDGTREPMFEDWKFHQKGELPGFMQEVVRQEGGQKKVVDTGESSEGSENDIN